MKFELLMSEAQRKGIELGREQGAAKEKQATALRMKAAQMSEEQISSILQIEISRVHEMLKTQPAQ